MSELDHTATSLRPTAGRAVWISGAILIAITFLTYRNSLHVPFFFDDPAAILDNPTIRDLKDWGQVLSPPQNGSGVAGRPIVNLSLALNYAWGGTAVTGYHLANLFFHGVAGLALFGCMRRTLLQPRLVGKFGDWALPLAGCSAALWLVHPLQTESVTCVIQRTELLVGLFYLLTLYGFVRAVDSPAPGWRVLAVVSCALGMASKEVMVSAPLIVLLYDRTFIAGSFAEAWRRRRALHLALMAGWLVLGLLVLRSGGTRGTAAGFGMGVTWWSYALKQCEAIILYVKLSAWPNPLVVFYGVDVITNPAEVWLQIVLLTGLVAGTIYGVWRNSVLGFLGAWFLAILAPSSSVVPLISQTVSEHRMYLSLAAPVVLATVGLFRGFGRPAVWLVGGAVVAMAITSARRNVDYASEHSIWTDTVAKVPQNARARVNLGKELKAQGHLNEALAEFQTALKYEPTSVESYNNIGTVMLERGQPADAIEPCRTALRLNPAFALAHNNLGTALVQTGKAAEGLTHLETALRLRPDFPEAHCNLTAALVELGQPQQAIVHGETAIRLRPDFALAHFFLSNAYLATRQTDRAIAELEAAIRAKPDYSDALLNLGSLYYQKGDPGRAVPFYQSVIRLKPGSLDARNNLASALFQLGRAEDAVTEYRATIQLQPTYAEAHLNLALVLERLGRADEAVAAYREALRLKPGDTRATEGLIRLRTNATPASAPPR